MVLDTLWILTFVSKVCKLCDNLLYSLDMLGIRYEQAEYIEQEMEKMVEQIKSIIQTLNADQVPLCIISFCGSRMFSFNFYSSLCSAKSVF